METILITGSSGFIGSNLIDLLKSRNKIIGISNKNQKSEKNIIHKKIDLMKNDFKVNPKISGIVHLAALTDVAYCNNYPKKCFDVNIMATEKILEFCRKKDSRMIFASSSHVYGNPKNIPIPESEELKPNSIYATSKIMGEKLCESYAKIYGMDITVLRFFSVFGPKSPPHNILNKIITNALKNNPIVIGNLYPKRDFIYIDDVVKSIEISLNSCKGFDIFNIGNEKSLSIKTICNNIEKIIGKKMTLISDEKLFRKNEIMEIRSQCKKIKSKLKWKSTITVNEGLKKTIEYYKKF